MKVLVVDDSSMMRGIIRRVLEENHTGGDLDIIDAENGEIAWKLVHENEVRLVFLDWNMPVLDGIDFVKRLRGEGIAIPVIMVSAITDEDSIYEAGSAGVTAYLEKPVRGGDVWELVRDYLR